MPVMKPLMGTPLNKAHPLSQGLVGCWLFNEGSGTTVYDSSGYSNNGTLAGTAKPSWISSSYGYALQFAASTNSIVSATLPVGLSLPFSYAITMTATTFDTGRYYFSFGSGSKGYLFDNSASHGLQYSNGTTGLFLTNTTTGSPITAVVTQASDGTANLYAAGTTGTHASGTNTPASINIGNVPGFSLSPAVTMHSAQVWNRVLSSQEVAYLTAFPFAMFDTDSNYQFDPSQINTMTSTGFPI